MSESQKSKRPTQEAERHEHVARMLRAVDVRAPEQLHERVRAMVQDKTSSSPYARARRAPPEEAGAPPREAGAARGQTTRELLAARLKPTLAAMAAAAAVGAAIALATGGGAKQASQGVSMSAASKLTLSAATGSAPQESSMHGGQLDMAVDGVAFPYWEEHFGWRASGTRAATIGGRRVTAVYYASPGGGRIGYAIVSGTPAPGVGGGTVVWREGVPYRVRSVNGAPVVTWEREGRLCVLSGRGVSAATLVRLASWGEGRKAA